MLQRDTPQIAEPFGQTGVSKLLKPMAIGVCAAISMLLLGLWIGSYSTGFWLLRHGTDSRVSIRSGGGYLTCSMQFLSTSWGYAVWDSGFREPSPSDRGRGGVVFDVAGVRYRSWMGQTQTPVRIVQIHYGYLVAVLAIPPLWAVFLAEALRRGIGVIRRKRIKSDDVAAGAVPTPPPASPASRAPAR